MQWTYNLQPVCRSPSDLEMAQNRMHANAFPNQESTPTPDERAPTHQVTQPFLRCAKVVYGCRPESKIKYPNWRGYTVAPKRADTYRAMEPTRTLALHLVLHPVERHP
jgi:hypothetical protein